MQNSRNAIESPQISTSPTRVRHVVLGLTVLAYMITYMDRAVIASATPVIRREMGFDLPTMSWIIAAFNWAYALFQIPGGWLGDRIGPRRALTIIVTWWSIFTSLTGAAWSGASMATVRFLFGMGEAGAFPIATRSLSRWILPSERGFAQGVTHAGSRAAAAFTPILVVQIILAWSWRVAFATFGSLGLLWAALWFWYYRDTPAEHSSVNPAERELIQASTGAPRSASRRVPWRAILSSGNLWVVCLMYFIYGYCFNIYLNWFPTYLNEYRHFTLKQMGFYSSLPLLAGVLGNCAGGTASDYLARRTGNLKISRRGVAIFGYLLAAAAIVPATLTHDPFACVQYTCLGVFGLELTVGVSWALPLDIGADAAGSVAALMNTWGNIGGAIAPPVFAYLVRGQGWDLPFLLTAGFCVVAAALFLKIDASRRIQIRGE